MSRRPRPDEAHLRRIAAITSPLDRGEDPFAWSDLPPAPTPRTHPTEPPMTDTTDPTPPLCERPPATPAEDAAPAHPGGDA